MDADEVLRIYKRQASGAKAYAAGATIEITAFTVPRGERWTVRQIFCRTTSGDNLIEFVRVTDVSEAVGMTEFVQAGATTLVYACGIPMVLEELDTLGFSLDGTGSVAGNADMFIDGFVEDIHPTA